MFERFRRISAKKVISVRTRKETKAELIRILFVKKHTRFHIKEAKKYRVAAYGPKDLERKRCM